MYSSDDQDIKIVTNDDNETDTTATAAAGQLILELPKTVQEMRQIIMQNKKRDPRNDNNIDLWQKHTIIQAL